MNDLTGLYTGRGGPLTDPVVLEFLLARALGMIFGVVDPSAYNSQIQFSKRCRLRRRHRRTSRR